MQRWAAPRVIDRVAPEAAESFSSAVASAIGFRVNCAPVASARNSRFRLTDIARIRATTGATIRLTSQATTIPRGSRLRLTIAGSSTAQNPASQLYPLSVPGTSRAAIGEAKVVLPVLKRPISRLP